MLRWSVWLLLALFFNTGTEVQAACDIATQTSERLSEAAEIELYRTQTDEWNGKDNSAKVSVRIAEEANSYCASNPGECGVSACCTNAFKEAEAGVESGYPQNDEKDMLLKVYLDIPAGLTTTGTLQCVVSQSTLRIIIGNARQKIYDDTGIWITYVDTVFYGIPPDNLLNSIIIPIACVVLLGVILTAVILHLWNKRREAIANRQKKIEERKKAKTAKVTPTYDIAKGDIVPGHQKKPPPKDDLYREKLLKSSQGKLMAAKNASIHSEDSAIKLESEIPHGQTNRGFNQDDASALEMQSRHLEQQPPAPWSDASVVEKKKKKKKKHKKSKDTESFATETEEETDM